MSAIQTIGIIIGCFLAVMGFIALAIPYIGGARQNAAIAALESTVGTLKTSNEILTSELHDVRSSYERISGENEASKAQIKILLEQRPSQELIIAMANDLNKHHRESMVVLYEVIEAVTNEP